MQALLLSRNRTRCGSGRSKIRASNKRAVGAPGEVDGWPAQRQRRHRGRQQSHARIERRRGDLIVASRTGRVGLLAPRKLPSPPPIFEGASLTRRRHRGQIGLTLGLAVRLLIEAEPRVQIAGET